MPEHMFFDVLSKLGKRIRISHDHWKLIIEQKHLELAGKEDEVKATLKNPLEIRRSRKDTAVFLHYRKSGRYYYCVVVKHLNGDGFIITAYLTKNIKEGARIWKR